MYWMQMNWEKLILAWYVQQKSHLLQEKHKLVDIPDDKSKQQKYSREKTIMPGCIFPGKELALSYRLKTWEEGTCIKLQMRDPTKSKWPVTPNTTATNFKEN